ncbi:zinc-dependent peptidase [Mariniflexile sp. AS56]|uniref:zinc-dependent peptidase n=1 Tax=Mariniflexile sp. AS56 TaxID=3063957 RepID=UPI0026EF9DBC|nr:zinc-dependent peptidase [Mariniflexile sp. AS56]MDO7171951.1 zinc-dependent peptidase [Mariniflexile sp. AS56]
MLNLLITEAPSLGSQIFIGLILAILVYVVLRLAFKMIEMGYVLKRKRPMYNHFYFRLRRLNQNQKNILQNQFSFYKKLSSTEKKHFNHRVASFMADKDFIARDGFVINDEVRVLVSATAIMLTFGFRDFYIGVISKIVIYPKAFYSNTNKAYHKGEFNPRLETLVLSWEDFVEGFRDGKDNINLGIHEFTHAIHINSLNASDVSATIFSDSFKELSEMLVESEPFRNKLMDSDYFRKYAFTNQYEFLAVIIENFMETPQVFKSQFPILYIKIKQMLNFNIAGY